MPKPERIEALVHSSKPPTRGCVYVNCLIEYETRIDLPRCELKLDIILLFRYETGHVIVGEVRQTSTLISITGKEP